jgi:hypothetical protein
MSPPSLDASGRKYAGSAENVSPTRTRSLSGRPQRCRARSHVSKCLSCFLASRDHHHSPMPPSPEPRECTPRTIRLRPHICPCPPFRARKLSCTSQSFHNEMKDLIPELREHRSAALHESRTTIGRCMSSHTKVLVTMSPVDGSDSFLSDEGRHTPRLLRWRSLEDLDLRSDKDAAAAATDEQFDIHTNKKRGTMAAEAAFHPRGTQSDHEASSSESEEGKSSDEEEDEMLERMLEKDMEDHGVTLSPTQSSHQAARLHKQHHRTRTRPEHTLEEDDDEDAELGGAHTVRRRPSMRIPGVDDGDEAKVRRSAPPLLSTDRFAPGLRGRTHAPGTDACLNVRVLVVVGANRLHRRTFTSCCQGCGGPSRSLSSLRTRSTFV